MFYRNIRDWDCVEQSLKEFSMILVVVLLSAVIGYLIAMTVKMIIDISEKDIDLVEDVVKKIWRS